MNWPPDLRDPSYAQAVLGAVTQGEHELEWGTLPVAGGGHSIELLFARDAMKIDGVRVNASATLQQQLADALGALLPTPKIMDLAWLARSATVLPVTMPVSSTSAAMVSASQQLDRERANVDTSGIVVQQKTWAIGNSLLTHAGRAMNYGFPVVPNQPGAKWNGIATEACVSFPTRPDLGRVIQGQGWAHDPSHLDYSQVVWLVHRACKVDGADADLASVLLDPTLAPLVSHEGKLDPRVLRQPRVPIFSCPLQHQPSPVAAALPPGGLCPAPPAPIAPTAPAARGLNWFAAALALAGAAAGGGVGVLLARSQGWNRETALLIGAGLGAIAGTVAAPSRQA